MKNASYSKKFILTPKFWAIETDHRDGEVTDQQCEAAAHILSLASRQKDTAGKRIAGQGPISCLGTHVGKKVLTP